MSYEGAVNKVSSQAGLDISPVSLWMHVWWTAITLEGLRGLGLFGSWIKP